MTPWNVMIILVWWLTTLDRYGVTCYKLMAEELRFKRQMKSLNKLAVTTIQTKYGDWYNCVDFYEQPGFDHPKLRKHKFDYQMSFSQRDYSSDASNTRRFDIWVNGKGCPPNTVPIRKIDKYDVLRANMAAEQVYNPNSDSGVHEFAVLRTNEENKYYGGGMVTSIYHPAVNPTQYSSSRIKIQNGPDSIAVGWVVNPSLYPDNGTHYFIYTTTKDSACYNTYCPGFIILRTDIPIDLLLSSYYSKPGGPVYEEKFFVRKDPANGNWFLQIGRDNATVGTWPQKIFTQLSDYANYVEWGGEVYGPTITDLPPMGAGNTPDDGVIIDNCFGTQVTIINDKNLVDYNPPKCSVYNSIQEYKLRDFGNRGEDVQRVILFGGPRKPFA